jgi:predicted nucleic-acid-binding protein
MKALDTNIVVRFVARDDAGQTVRADNELTSGKILLTHTVLMETEWVLRSIYKMRRAAVGKALADILCYSNVETDDPDAIDWVLRCHAEGADFADMIHLAFARAADEFVTFDKRLASGPVLGDVPIRLA